MEGILVDILIITVFLITVGVSTHRGFVKSAIGIAVIFCSFVAAKMSGGPVGVWIDGVFLFNVIDNAFASFLQATIGELSGAIDGAALVEKIPEALRNMLDLVGMDISEFINSIGIVTEENLRDVSESIAHPVSAFVAEVIGYLGVFIIGLIVFKMIGSLVVGIFKLPLLRTLDKALGFLAGSFAGFLLSWGFAFVFRTAMSLLSIQYPELLPFADTEGSYLYDFLINFTLN